MKKFYTLKYALFVFVLLFAFAATDFFVGSAQKNRSLRDSSPQSSPKVSISKNNYRIGENVRLLGQDFLKFEQILVTVSNRKQNISNWTIFADENGHISTDWRMPSEGKFSIKFVGNESLKSVQIEIASFVAPVQISGNPSCASLNSSTNPAFSHINSNFGYKIDGAPSGTFAFVTSGNNELTGGAPSDPNNSVTTTVTGGNLLSWTSTIAIDAVIVKGGTGGANIYAYDPASGFDSGLQTPNGQGISHIEFCYDYDPASVTIIKDSQPNTALAFGFTASGQVTSNFSLVDNGVIGPDRTTFSNLTNFGAANSITITENSLGSFYSLTQINCVSNANGGLGTNNNSISVPARLVNIVLEESEQVTCTFVNAVTTSSPASVSGLVATETGAGLSRVSVTIQNTSTLAAKTATTNSFGRYQFENLESGAIYVLTVQNTKLSFTPNSRTIILNENAVDADFTAVSP